MPYLNILRVEGSLSDGCLDKLSDSYYNPASKDTIHSDCKPRLDVVHISDIDPRTASTLATVPMILNARQIRFHNLRPVREFITSSPIGEVEEALSGCVHLWPLLRQVAPDVKIVGANKRTPEALVALGISTSSQ